jgi:hypothetical protein
VNKSYAHWKVLAERKRLRLLNQEKKKGVSEENVAAEIQTPVEIIQKWIEEKKLSLIKLPMSVTTQQVDSGIPSELTTMAPDVRLSKLETIIAQLGQSVQLIAEDVKSLKDSALVGYGTVAGVKQQDVPILETTKSMCPLKVNVAASQQIEINKLLNVIPTNGVYNSGASGAALSTSTGKGYQKTSTPVGNSAGNSVSFPTTLDAMSPLKQESSVHNTFSTPFIPTSVNVESDSYQPCQQRRAQVYHHQPHW